MASSRAAFLLQRWLLMLSVCAVWLSPGCSGDCFFDAKGTCQHQGREYGLGETWMTKECYQCICLNPFGVGCCDDIQQPVDYPDWCEVVRKPESCSVAIVMKANRRVPCTNNIARERLAMRGREGWNEPDFLF
ncbi:hypothetical protein NDU88_000935 [Pleurodeles waltl]|uniref:Prostate-associated microseminoprotein n=1 Tax=Pleurodeles waltl TaxID=8319 RepID=A0AAV7KN97_PLEWA|nr:hypothetical protein NDU88_000935 [Pleurodeles waltl]